MVKSFQFSGIPVILFKPGSLAELPAYIKNYGNTIALVTGMHSFDRTPSSVKLFTDLEKYGIKHFRITISGEPSPSVTDHAVDSLKNEKIDVVVAIGGGSVLDAGKAISAMMYKTGSVKEYLEGVGVKMHPGTKVPFIAVPTTSGTGSEATCNAVISEVGKNGFKKSLRHKNFLPDIAVVDPELSLYCPPDITAASGMDCFTQLTEAFLSDKSNPYTDALAMEGIKAIKTSFERACKSGEDIGARTGMSFAALTSGICLANAGLGIVHGFAGAIGGMYDIPHGLVCGILMAPANEINVRELRKNKINPTALKKYEMLGMIFSDEKNKTNDYYIDTFIEYLEKLSYLLNFKGLKQYGINEEDISTICKITEHKNNPIKLSENDLIEIINRVL